VDGVFDRLRGDLDRVGVESARLDRLAVLGTISGLIAHELNNLLTPAVGYGRAALRRPDDIELTRKALRRCVEATERAALVAESVLDLVSGGAEGSGAADVASVVRAHVGAHGVSVEGVPLHVAIESDLRVAMRSERLERVLQNLVANARRAMAGRTGAVRLTACSTGNTGVSGRPWAEIVVEDDGPGLPVGEHERVFDPFVTGSRRSGGRGLGLTLVRELVRDAGGSIRAEVAESGGARFVVELPLAAASADAAA